MSSRAIPMCSVVLLYFAALAPFEALLDDLEGGQTLDDFLGDFPTVTRETAVHALEHAKSLVVGQLG
jgi:hypothetical protein